MMRQKEETISPDSANISDMKDDDDDRAESRERSRGKRRTAREIATMFEQLKQRHISRKKEWLAEREDLMKRVQMADESKRVLAELKSILENLREELRMEEKKRIEMETGHLEEKRQWENEKQNLLQGLETNAQEGHGENEEVKHLKEKLAEQSRMLTEWQATVIDLKKQLLEKENRLLRERRELQLELEKDRASWKKKERTLTEKIRQLDNKSAQSSTSSTSPGAASSRLDDVNKDALGADSEAAVRRRSSTTSVSDSSRYNNFQRTVDDALKQIEKMSEDLKDIDQPKHRSQRSHLTQSASEREYDTPSPRPKKIEEETASNAPWRTKQRSKISNAGRPTAEKSLISNPSAKSELPSSDTLPLPSVKTTQLKVKRSPNPERKIKMINVSSPDAPDSKWDPYQSISGSSSPHDFVQTPEHHKNKSKASEITENPKSDGSITKAPRSRVSFLEDETIPDHPNSPKHSQTSIEKSYNTRGRQPENRLSVKEDDIVRGRSTSPRLPKLHQQLLFKKEPSGLSSQKSFETESLASTDKGKTSDDEPRLLSTYTDKVSLAKPKDNVALNTHTPYFDPNVGYLKGSRMQSKAIENNTDLPSKQRRSISTEKPQVPDAKVTSNQDEKQISNQNEDLVPPLVHPKPKVSIHKAPDGSIVRVSPANENFDRNRKSASPDSTPSSEKQYSIAERMGRAGRDWIRKRLSFKDRKPEDHRSSERTQYTPPGVVQQKKRGKTKSRQRSSSLLRKRADGRENTSTSDESTDNDRRERPRELFLRRSKRKDKSEKGGSPRKSKPKRYTRSKTEASSQDMKNFFDNFKASQSNVKKPSVVKQFELRLLENEVRTLTEENAPRTQINNKNARKLGGATPTTFNSKLQEDGYLSGDEEDGAAVPEDRFVATSIEKSAFLPVIKNTPGNKEVTMRQKNKLGPPVKPKTYYRKSMPDFKTSATTYTHGCNETELPNKRNPAVYEAGEVCNKKVVSSLVDRFSTKSKDQNTGINDTTKPIQNRSTRRSSAINVPVGRNSPNESIPRSHSMSSHDTSYRVKRTSKPVSNDASISYNDKNRTSNVTNAVRVSWRDRVTHDPGNSLSQLKYSPEKSSAHPGDREVSRSQRISDPPNNFDSVSDLWEKDRDAAIKASNLSEESSNKSILKKTMSEEMKRKASILERALVKGPHKPRRYRRADTQPVHSTFRSSSDSENSDIPTRYFGKEDNVDNTQKITDKNEQNSEEMHIIIPPVTSKFSKPAKPGRLPSRWAR